MDKYNWKKYIRSLDLTGLNRRRLKVLIKIQRRVVDEDKKFDIRSWQWQAPSRMIAVVTEKKLHACGTAACFAGYVALSPEWKRAGGRINLSSGAPILNYRGGQDALSEYLSLDDDLFMRRVCVWFVGGNIRMYGLRKPNAAAVLKRLEYALEITA